MATAIRLEALSKQYRIGVRRERHPTLRFALAGTATATLNRLRPARRAAARQRGELIWALRDVSCSIEAGEVVGIIGRNGAGKSTLLKVLSRITEPTDGYADISGRVGSLLEIGIGFHPELTGRENIYLYGAILGLKKREIDRRFDEIVEFAEIAQFLDTPVKRYSSGMTVRIAFAVAAHLEPEILLVDEVLAVGDLAFQKKCLGKMSGIASEGRTVLFVSHNMAVIQALCRRGIFLQDGELVEDAPIDRAISAYLKTLEQVVSADLLERTDREGAHDVRLAHIGVSSNDEDGHLRALATGRPARFDFDVTDAHPRLSCAFTIYNNLGHPVVTFNSRTTALDDGWNESRWRYTCEIGELPLTPGRYRLDVELRDDTHLQDSIEAAAFFDVEPGALAGRSVSLDEKRGDILVRHRWLLPGSSE
jgi:homopolymeric O-antigen transport system ATP-binding protein